MALTAAQIALTEAIQYDYKVKTYATTALTWTEGRPDLTALLALTVNASDGTLSDNSWTDITSLVHAISLTHTQNENIASWEARLEGEAYSAVLARDCPVVSAYCTRYAVNGVWTAWTDWTMLFRGIVIGNNQMEDSRDAGQWRVTVAGLAGLLRVVELEPQAWGRINLAAGKPVTVSSTIPNAALEANTGEYVGTSTNIIADNLVDEAQFGIPWIAQTAPNASTVVPPLPLPGPKHLFISEIYTTPPPGYDPHLYQWFEVFYDGNDGPIDLVASASQATRFANEYTIEDSSHPGWPGTPWLDLSKLYGHVSLQLSGGPDEGDVLGLEQPPPVTYHGSHGIFCYDKSRFLELFDAGDAEFIYEWRNYRWFDVDGDENPIGENFHLGTTHTDTYGAPFLAMLGAGDPASFDDFVCWSDDSAVKAHDPRNFTLTHSDVIPASVWTGDPIAYGGLTAGQSFGRFELIDGVKTYYAPDTKSAASWGIETYPNPGMFINPDRFEWASVDLGEPECYLEYDYDADGTDSATLRLNSTLGLLESGAAIVAGRSFIYGGRTATTLTQVMWDDPSPIDLGIGTPVYQYDATNAVAIHGWRVKEIKLFRKPGQPLIAAGRLAGSLFTSPEYPSIYNREDHDFSTWLDDWPLWGPTAFTMTESAWSRQFATAVVMRHLLVAIDRMADDGLAKLNEIEVWADDVLMEGTLVGADATSDTVIRYLLCTIFSLPTAYLTTTRGLTVRNQNTTRSALWQVINQLATIYGAWLQEDYTNHFTWERNPWNTLGGLPTSSVLLLWNKANLTSVAFDRTQPKHAVGRIKLSAKAVEGQLNFNAVYPPLSYTVVGATSAVNGILVGSQAEADALAMALYAKSQADQQLTLTLIAPAPWAMAGQLHDLEWLCGSPERLHISPTHGFHWLSLAANHELVFKRGTRTWNTNLTLQRFPL